MLYLDTEFNGFGGELISLALVSSVNGEEFYGVLPLPKKIHPWVKKNVIPYLEQAPETRGAFETRLIAYLRRHEHEDIIADWPEDFVHLLKCLCAPFGFRVDIDPTLVLITTDGKVNPVTPPNALSDARALMYWHKTYRTI